MDQDLSTQNREVRPSFSVRYFVFLLISTLVATAASLLASTTLNKLAEQPEDQKTLVVMMLPAQDIVAIPENITQKLELTLSVSPTDKQVVKGLFSFQVFIRNEAKKTTAEDILVYLNPPKDVELIDPPVIKTVSKILEMSTQRSQKSIEGGGIIFTLDQL